MTRPHVRIALFTVSALLVAGCAKGAPLKGDEPITLTWSIYGAQLNIAYPEIANSEQFKAEFPNVTIVFNDEDGKVAASESATRVPNCVENNNCYDIEEMEQAYAAQVFPLGSFISLNDYGVDLSKFPDVAAAVVTAADGKIYGIPVDTAPMLMFYRIDLVRTAYSDWKGYPDPSTLTPTALAALNTEVETYMANVTWDDYVTNLAPRLLSPDDHAHVDTAYNQGYPVFPVHTSDGLSGQFFPPQTNWLKDGHLNPSLIPFIRKYVSLSARIYRGLGNGVPPTSPSEQATARANSFLGPLRWVNGTKDACGTYPSDPMLNVGAFALTTDSAFWTDSAFCQLKTGQTAMVLGAAWRGGAVSSWLSGLDSTPDVEAQALADATGAFARINRLGAKGTRPAWSNGLWRSTVLPGLEAGDGLPTTVDHLYSLDGGSYIGVTKSCQHPEVAVRVIRYFAETIHAQIHNFKSFGGFPALKEAWNEQDLHKPDPFFGNRTWTPDNITTMNNVNSTSTRQVKQGICQAQVAQTFNVAVSNLLAIDTQDLRDSNLTNLQDQVIATVESALPALLADPTKCNTF